MSARGTAADGSTAVQQRRGQRQLQHSSPAGQGAATGVTATRTRLLRQLLRHALELAPAVVADPGQLHLKALLLVVHLVQAA